VVAREADLSKVDIKLSKPGKGTLTEAEKKIIAASYPQKIAAKATATAKSLIPTKYNSGETSGLSYLVKTQSNTAVDFELKD